MNRVSFLVGCWMVVGVASAAGYPESDKVTFYVSPDTVSTWTETAAEDYLVPDSQVFITGRGPGAHRAFGLLGVMVDRWTNSSAASAAESSFRLNFVPTLSTALRRKIADRSYAEKLIQVESERDAQLVLLPSAKLKVSEGGVADLSFRLTVRIRDHGTDGGKKNYFVGEEGTRPIVGTGSWAESGAAALRTSADRAFETLADTLLDAIEVDNSKDWTAIRERELAKLGGGDCARSSPQASRESYYRRGKALIALNRYQAAMECFMRVQEQADDSSVYRESCTAIGTMYELGWGVEKDIPTAMIWFKKAGL